MLPDSVLQDRVTDIKLELKRDFGCKQALKSPPHITVFPPFRWDPNRLDAFACLSEFCDRHSSFEVSLNGFGSFPPRVIYVKPEMSDSLQLFHQELQAYLSEHLELLDPMVAKRGFTPHMTVANRDLKRDRFSDAWAKYEQRSLEATFQANQLTLLKHDGQRWQIAQEWPFGALS